MVKDKITSRDSRIDRWLESLGLAGCAIGLAEDEMETPAVFHLVAPFPVSQDRTMEPLRFYLERKNC